MVGGLLSHRISDSLSIRYNAGIELTRHTFERLTKQKVVETENERKHESARQLVIHLVSICV